MRKMEHDDRWGWAKAIDSSHQGVLKEKWWIGENRWGEYSEWPDLEKATRIYYNMYTDLTQFHEQCKTQYDNRFLLLDEICPQRNWILAEVKISIIKEVVEWVRNNKLDS